MSWSLSGNLNDLGEFSTNSDTSSLNEDNQQQLAFLKKVLKDGVDEGLLEGYYTVSLGGHSDPSVEGDRKSLYLSTSPMTAPVAAVDEAPESEAPEA